MTANSYLRDLFRGLRHWPRNRYLELAPKYGSAFRQRLDSVEFATELRPAHDSAAPRHDAGGEAT